MGAEPWPWPSKGVLQLPSGRLVRGRGLRRSDGPRPSPEFGLYLLGRTPPEMGWEARWVRWPDWWLPLDRRDAREALVDAWERAASQRVEIACGGGSGRTGTALACLAVLDGLPPRRAVAFVRRHYRAGAVEMPWQSRYVRNFGESPLAP
ncbi:MAG: protein phosphatase [Actinomycetota bacterium]|nr:protein phosphatase [Actinomycetota bacterium]